MDMMDLRRGLLMEKAGVAYEAWDLLFDRTNYVNTGVQLFSQANINRDFEVVIAGIQGDYTSRDNETLVCAKENSTALGFLIRPNGSAQHTYNGTISIQRNTKSTVVVRRTNGVLSCEGSTITNQPVPFAANTVFDYPLVFGCGIYTFTNVNTWQPFRYCAGSIDHVIVKWI